MIWESWSAFFSMGGYALYVWGSVVSVSICILGELFLLKQRRKAINSQITSMQQKKKYLDDARRIL